MNHRYTSRESFMAFFTRAFLIIMVVAAAQGFAITGASMSQRISDLQGVVAQVVSTPDNLQLARQREAQLQQSGEFRPGTRPFEAARTTTDVAAGASQTVPEAMHTARHAPAAASTPAQQPPAPISTAQAAAAVQARQPVGEHTGSNTKTSPVTAPEVQVTQNSSSQTGDAPSGTRGAGIGDSQSPKAKGSRGIASPNRKA
ncbi:MAG: hypothetical protein Q4G70_09750 [Pseudomonadota bacterium]|nr:hypothetical protein [Pseudomonadota bacterium]